MGIAAVFVRVLAVDMHMDIEVDKSTSVDIF
jgi:hypothetical protein